VSDLYQETAEPPDTSARDPGADHITREQPDTARPEPGYRHESPGESRGDDGYQETDAEVRARIASQDELPTPEQSRVATWGDNPQYYYDDADLTAEYDGDASVFQSWEDDLPTPEESHAATWGDRPQYYDEAYLASEYDGDLGSLTTRYAGHEAGPEEKGMAGSDSGLPPDERTDTESGQVNDAEHPQEGSSELSSPEAIQIRALEAERDQARQEKADLKAENARKAALIDRQTTLIEQLLARDDAHQGSGEASAPDRTSEEPTAWRDQDLKSPTIEGRKGTEQGADAADAEQPLWRRTASAENVGAVGTVLSAAGLFLPGASGLAFGLGAAAIGGFSLVQAKLEKKHGKGKA
jgi:hypothetical protein